MRVEHAQDIRHCAQEYQSNSCDRPIPFLKAQCLAWETCMHKDPTHVIKSKVLFRLLGELLSDFFEGFLGRMSPKTCVSLGTKDKNRDDNIFPIDRSCCVLCSLSHQSPVNHCKAAPYKR